jgi:LmbE family N-acetylglucosaminyl deacetylase
LAATRVEESADARSRLGLDGCPVDRLGMPDGRVATYEDDLTGVLRPLIDGADLVLAPWRNDGHPDHDACGHAAARAAIDCGTPLIEYLVWMWNWARPDDPRVPWVQGRRVDLDCGEREAKYLAMDAFRSQTRPIGPGPTDAAVLPAAVLAYHRRPFEVLLV